MGLQLRQLGYRNYADFDLWVDHLRSDGKALGKRNTGPDQMLFLRESIAWRGEVIEYDSKGVFSLFQIS
jgi:hypothetical protein